MSPSRTSRHRRAVPFLALLTFAGIPLLFADTTDLNLVVVMEGRSLGEIAVRIDTDASRVVGVHRRFFDLAAPFARVPTSRDTVEWWTPEELSSEGFSLTFDVSRVLLDLEIDPKVRLEQVHSLGKRYSFDDVNAEPEALSGGVNVYGRSTYERDEAAIGDAGEYLLRLEPFLNVKSWVLEGEVSYDSAGAPPLELTEYRAVHDLIPQRLRLEAGTLRYPTIAAQGRVDIVGFSVSRRFELDPRRSSQTDTAEFFLERGGDVKVFLNDRQVLSDTLMPGAHLLEGIPFSPGRNELRVEAEGETLQLIVPHDADLLRPGLSDLSVAAGVLKDRFDSPAASAFFRRGITTRWSAGAYTHLDADTQTAGLESTNVFAIGGFRTTLSASRARTEWQGTREEDRLGYATSMTYRYTVPGSRISSVIVSCNARSRYYSSAGELKRPNVYFGDASASLGIRLTRISSASVGLRGNLAYEDDRDSLTASISGRTRLGSSLQFFAGFQTNLAGEDTFLPQGTITLAYFPETRGNVRGSVTQDFGDAAATTVSVSGEGRRSGSGLRWNADAMRAPGDDRPYGLDGALRYAGNRGELQFGSRANFGGEDLDPAYRFEGGFDTALLFAGKTAAIGSPVNDSFILLRKHRSLEEATVGVRSGDGWERRTDILGPAAVGGYGSYRFQRLSIDAEGVRDEVDAGNLSYLLYPAYRSGYSITVGTDASVYASGTMTNREGGPLPLAYLEARRDGAPEALKFFTDEDGAFEIYGLKPGVWDVTAPKSGLRGRIVIPPDARGYVDAGVTIMEES